MSNLNFFQLVEFQQNHWFSSVNRLISTEFCQCFPSPWVKEYWLSLLQQLACDINNDTPRKLTWMTDVAAAINPTYLMVAMHVRPIFEQVYQILNHQRSSPSMTGTELSNIRLLLHVTNSVLMSCKWFSLLGKCANSLTKVTFLEYCTKLSECSWKCPNL